MIAKLIRSVSQFQVYHFQNDALQYQNARSDYSFSIETFDPARQTIHFETISEEGRQHLDLNGKYYQLFMERTTHSHTYMEMMVVLSGSVCNHVGEEVYIYQQGQGCLMNPNIRHKEEPVSNPPTPAEVLFINLRREFLQELFDEMHNERTNLKGSVVYDFLHGILEDRGNTRHQRHYLDFSPFGSVNETNTGHKLLCVDAIDALRKRKPGFTLLARAAILGFLNDLGDASLYAVQSTSSSLSHHEFLVSKIDLLIRASHGGIRIQEMESLLSYNGDYLNRLYRQQKGISISDSCKHVRIHDAKYLLKHTDMTIDEIMQSLGVTSRGSFFSQFQKAEGMTPKEYRKSLPDSAHSE